MTKTGRMLIAGVGATAMMAAAVGSASGRSLSASSQTLRGTFREVGFTADSTGSRATCALTIEGSFHSRTIAKVAYSLTGYITSSNIGSCVGGGVTLLRETLPWHTKYENFTGTLPNIASVRILVTGIAFRVQPTGSPSCLFRTTDAEHGGARFNREAAGALTSIDVGPSRITSQEGCAFGFRTTGTISGASTGFTALNSASRITVTLI